ncbi:hypothetical protein L964_794 [Leuconostoc pseudomesenteroides 1159]|nr:hypothetical protein L964_794 [Leuconostoc pseudomesenteroides 1159]
MAPDWRMASISLGDFKVIMFQYLLSKWQIARNNLNEFSDVD